MKPAWQAALCVALLLLPLHFQVIAQSPDSSSGLLLLSKELDGLITRNTLNLTLRSNADCDKTQRFIPDDSRLASESFFFNVDNTGVGTFQGPAQIVSPDGRLILQGFLRGTVGVNTRCNPNRACRTPWHLEGIFEGQNSAFGRSISRSATDARRQVVMLHFSADLNQESASPLPRYRGRLDGFVSEPPPIAERVSIFPDKAGYNAGELITAIIVNNSDQSVVAFDQQSYCTIVQLQMQDGDRWTDIGVCPLDRLPLPTVIPPGQKLEVPLRPTQFSPPLAPGAYRLALSFKVGAPVYTGNDLIVVASRPFRIIAPPAAGRVSVTTDRDSYDVGDVIVAQIKNGNDQTIVTWDHQTNCTIVTLQKQEGNEWVNLAPCPLLSPTLLVPIEAHKDYWVKLPAGNASSVYAPGVYRLEFTYFFVNSAGQPTGDPITVYSSSFKLTAKE